MSENVHRVNPKIEDNAIEQIGMVNQNHEHPNEERHAKHDTPEALMFFFLKKAF